MEEIGIDRILGVLDFSFFFVCIEVFLGEGIRLRFGFGVVSGFV